MKKIVIKINCNDEFYDEADGYIIGFNDFSILFEKTYGIVDIKKIRKRYVNKKIFVSLNKPIFNGEIKRYKKVLDELDNINLDGIIVSDVATLTYDLKTNIILDFMHLNNSYLTINHYYNNGAFGVFLTNDITLDEINEIRKNTKAILFKQVFGYAHLSTSKRSFITNYFNYYKKDKNDSRYYEISEDKKEYYKVIEEDKLTHILSSKVLNLLKYINDINADYFVIDSYLIKDNMEFVTKSFINNDIKQNEIINKIYNADDGFIDKKTIYKVISNEK